MDLDEIRQILELVREHELAEFELERDDLKLRIRKDAGVLRTVNGSDGMAGQTEGGPGPLPTARPPASHRAPAPDPAAPEGQTILKSPIVGTLYRAPEPGAPPFVEVGQRVRKGQVLCIIEAMKLMNEIDAECDGEIVAIFVENGQPVQYGDRLFAIGH